MSDAIHEQERKEEESLLLEVRNYQGATVFPALHPKVHTERTEEELQKIIGMTFPIVFLEIIRGVKRNSLDVPSNVLRGM